MGLSMKGTGWKISSMVRALSLGVIQVHNKQLTLETFSEARKTERGVFNGKTVPTMKEIL